MIGIVCETAAIRLDAMCSRVRYCSWNAPDPKPQTGRSANMLAPPVTRPARPLVALSSAEIEPSLRPTVPGVTSTTASAAPSTAAAVSTTGSARQRSAASTARPTSSAAKLDCDSDSTSPAHSTASAAASSAVWRPRSLHSSRVASASIVRARKRP